MSGNLSASNNPLCGHDNVRDRFAAVLRAAMRRGWSYDALADASGVPARTIKSYLVEGKEPGLANALSIMCVLGKAGVNPVLALIGWNGTPMDEADEINLPGIVAGSMANLATIAAAAADGRLDHTEEADCRAAADQIIATVLPLSSAGAAQ